MLTIVLEIGTIFAGLSQVDTNSRRYKIVREPDYEQDNLKLYNADCMDIMKQYPDNYFDLTLVDPPYGKRPSRDDNGTFGAPNTRRFSSKDDKWDIKPPKEYFIELMRVSKNQVIWGGNYFIDNLKATNCFIVWDKKTGNNMFADCELAWTSFKSVTKKIELMWLGAHCNRVEPNRIHPTQKPVKLYNWIYANYAEPGQRILDTHLGSGSNAISAHYAKMGEFVGIELDEDYFKASVKRIHSETRQLELF